MITPQGLPSAGATKGLADWTAYITDSHGSPPDSNAEQRLRDMIAPDAVFHSPVVHTPQVGAPIVHAYLWAAAHVLGGPGFTYVRSIASGDEACLEFTQTIDGIVINGIDLIRWDDAGRIVDFKVMVRPMKAMNKLWELMAARLAE